VAVLIAGLVIFADWRFNEMAITRYAMSTIGYPFYWVTDLPARFGDWSEHTLVARSTLLEDNRRLRTESLVLTAQTRQMASLRADNTRLRALLNSSALLQDDILAAELIGISPNPSRHFVMLDKGERDGVFVGQPLIDAQGLMGQVIEVGPFSSRVLLITDSRHALSVQINRSGVRGIIEGIGELDQLELRHISATTDVREGDLLVTSGLGDRFPEGYPVAVVTRVERDPSESFALVQARPSAALRVSRHVLLVFTPHADDQ
jgi:rod shape-determining protein MreC